MKRIAIILVLITITIVSVTSCKSTKPPCPAYRSSNAVTDTQAKPM